MFFKKPCFTGTNDTYFTFLGNLFFFKFCQNFVKSAIFWPKILKFWLKFFEKKNKKQTNKKTQNIFKKKKKKYLQKTADLKKKNCVFGVIFATRNNNNKEVPNNRPYLGGPSARKTVPFLVTLWDLITYL